MKLCVTPLGQSMRTAIELKADQPYYHNTLGVALYYQDRLEEAAAECTRSLELMTSQPLADWCFLAMIESRLGNMDEAKVFQDKALEWHREHPSSDEDSQWILDEMGRVPELQPSIDD